MDGIEGDSLPPSPSRPSISGDEGEVGPPVRQGRKRGRRAADLEDFGGLGVWLICSAEDITDCAVDELPHLFQERTVHSLALGHWSFHKRGDIPDERRAQYVLSRTSGQRIQDVPGVVIYCITQVSQLTFPERLKLDEMNIWNTVKHVPCADMVGQHDRYQDVSCKDMVRLWADQLNKSPAEIPIRPIMMSREFASRVDDSWTVLKVVPLLPNIRFTKHLLSNGPPIRLVKYWRAC